MKVPINRMQSPEVIGGGIEVEYKQVGFSEGQLDLSNNKTDDPLLMSTTRDQEFYFTLGLADNADIYVKVPEESASMIGIKIQVLGASSKNRNITHQLAFILGMGAERDSFSGGGLNIELKSDAKEFGLIHGFRYSEWILIYEGITLSQYEFSGLIENAPATFSDSEFEYKASNIFGFHVGLELGSVNFKSRAEIGYQNINWTSTGAKSFYSFGYSLGAAF